MIIVRNVLTIHSFLCNRKARSPCQMYGSRNLIFSDICMYSTDKRIHIVWDIWNVYVLHEDK